MIVDTSLVFDNQVFVLNDNPTIKTIDTEVAKITIIDNFYEDIQSVVNQLSKLSMSLIWEQDDNNITFLDARKVYSGNMKGTELTYVRNESLKNLVSTIIDYPSQSLLPSQDFVVNCFTFTDDFDSFLDENYYGCHRDNHTVPEYDGCKSTGQIALVIFLNEHYEEGEGLNFYNVSNDVPVVIRTKKSEIKKIHTVQGKQNRAVLFDSQFPHGQHTPTNQFKNEMRYTQVIFVPTF